MNKEKELNSLVINGFSQVLNIRCDGDAHSSSVTIIELLVGVHARFYAKILKNLFGRGAKRMQEMLIGATAIANGYPVLTVNESDFKRIDGLEVVTSAIPKATRRPNNK